MYRNVGCKYVKMNSSNVYDLETVSEHKIKVSVATSPQVHQDFLIESDFLLKQMRERETVRMKRNAAIV